MSMPPPPPGPAPPVIPPIPSRARKGRIKRRKEQPELVWSIAFTVGLALGAALYQWVPGVDSYCDYWLAALLG